jgi:hypothetical protein
MSFMDVRRRPGSSIGDRDLNPGRDRISGTQPERSQVPLDSMDHECLIMSSHLRLTSTVDEDVLPEARYGKIVMSAGSYIYAMSASCQRWDIRHVQSPTRKDLQARDCIMRVKASSESMYMCCSRRRTSLLRDVQAVVQCMGKKTLPVLA